MVHLDRAKRQRKKEFWLFLLELGQEPSFSHWSFLSTTRYPLPPTCFAVTLEVIRSLVDLHCIIGLTHGSPACRWLIVGLLGSHVMWAHSHITSLFICVCTYTTPPHVIEILLVLFHWKTLILVFVVACLFCRAGDQTQRFAYARHAFYHWAIFPASKTLNLLPCSFLLWLKSLSDFLSENGWWINGFRYYMSGNSIFPFLLNIGLTYYKFFINNFLFPSICP
jgi:hypothetical protein